MSLLWSINGPTHTVSHRLKWLHSTVYNSVPALGGRQIYNGFTVYHSVPAMGHRQIYNGFTVYYSVPAMGHRQIYNGFTVYYSLSPMGHRSTMALLLADDHKEQPADGGTPTPSPPSPPSDSHSGSESAPGQGSDSGGDPQVKTGSHKVYTDEVIASLVDVVLNSYDKDDDGYVEYFEYKAFKDSVETHG